MSKATDHASVRRRRRLVNDAKTRLRELRIELAALNHHVGTRIELKDSDLDTLDVIARHGPLTPTVLARRMGVHVATLTGILNRLEAGGWITRERDPADRRAVVLASVPDRIREVFARYDGMNRALDEILGGYTDKELAVIVDFLERSTQAGRAATDELADAGDAAAPGLNAPAVDRR